MERQRDSYIKSLIAADFGSVNTRLVLIDLVDGQYRLVSRTQIRTTIGSLINDVTIGLSRAIENLQEITERPLVDEQSGVLILPENEDGSGIDELIVTSSAGRPLQAVLVGLMEEVSIASARRALTGSYVQVAGVLSLADTRDEEAQINQILQAKPDLIFLIGGTDGGNTSAVMRLLRAVKLAIKIAPEEEKPIVLYAGNRDIASTVSSELHDTTQVFIAKNVRPSIDTEHIASASQELAMVYSAFMSRQPGGFETVADFSKVGLIPTAQSVTNMVRWLGESSDKPGGVLHLDIGSTTSTLAAAVDREVYASVFSHLGLGHSIISTLQTLDMALVQRWLPFLISEEELYNYAHDKALMPATLPQDEKDLLIMQAIAREIIRVMVKQTIPHVNSATGGLPPLRQIVAAGAALTQTEHPGVTAMLLLDALDFEGVSELYIDSGAVLSALGAIAYLEPLISVQVFENKVLGFVGTVFSPQGKAESRSKRPAMSVTLTFNNGTTLSHDIYAGEAWAAPLAPGEEALVDIRMAGGMRLNGQKRWQQGVVGGLAGVIFDGRGHPLLIPDVDERAAVFARWRSAFTNISEVDWSQQLTAAIKTTAITARSEREIRRERLQEQRDIRELITLASRLEESQVEEPQPRKKKRKKPGQVEPKATAAKPADDEFPDVLSRL